MTNAAILGLLNKGRIVLVDSVAGSDSGSDFSLDISSVSFQAGDLGVFIFTSRTNDSTYTIDIDGSSGNFTEIHSDAGSAPQDIILSILLAGDETTISSSTGGDWTSESYIFMVFRNAALPTTSTRAATDDDAMPDPPEITSVGETSLVLITGHIDGKGVVTIEAPSGYTMINQINYLTLSATMAAYKLLPSSTEDPGRFVETNNTPWAAHTIEILEA